MSKQYTDEKHTYGKQNWAVVKEQLDKADLRRHNDYDELVTQALMREHSEDWSMETIREAALIATNTMLPLIKSYGIQQRIEEHDKWKSVAEEIVQKDGVYRAVNYLNERAVYLTNQLERNKNE